MTSDPARDRLAAQLTGAAKFRDCLSRVSAFLADSGLPDAQAEARALFRALPRPENLRFERFLDRQHNEFPELLALANNWVMRRLAREPLDRIVGKRAFWTLELELSPATLSPRADTETLVSAALDHVSQLQDKTAAIRILDLGTGSGAILLALLSELPMATGLGIDLSSEAIVTAKGNAARNDARAPGLAARAEFMVGSWFEPAKSPFDLIVSNPPYIPASEIETLDIEVRDHDPRLALDGGSNGLDAYRSILSEAAAFLAENGLILLEIGQGQEQAVELIASRNGLGLTSSHRDLGGILRVIGFQKPETVAKR
jgi:release factor glutamine methyltransferase